MKKTLLVFFIFFGIIYNSHALEVAESIDMMRFLEHGDKVHMVETEFDTFSVDTPEDLVKIEKLIKTDHLIKEYI